MMKFRRRSGFTLIELLTVIAIITLLIGILTPSLNRARDEAKKAAIKAQLNAVATGLEMFQNDQQKYPPSNAGDMSNFDPARNFVVGDVGAPLQGANLLVDAMVGRDFLGYDPNPTRQASGNTPAYYRWDPANTRREKYIDPAGLDSSRNTKAVEDAFGAFGNSPPAANDQATPAIDNGGGTSTYCPVFLDKFGWPILYYRANPSATQRSSIMQDGQIVSNNAAKNGAFYNGFDNRVFTEHASGPNPGQKHEINEASASATYTLQNGQFVMSAPNNFAEFIKSFRSSSRDASGNFTVLRPVNEQKFILLTPGKDGIYGTLDDVANFEVKSEAR